jgi:hypothetical protein
MAGMWPAADTEPSVAFVSDAAPVEWIFTHIGEPPTSASDCPARGPPAWADVCSRADAGLGPLGSARARLQVRSAHLLVTGVSYASRCGRPRLALARSAAESRPIAPPSARLHRQRASSAPWWGPDRSSNPPPDSHLSRL